MGFGNFLRGVGAAIIPGGKSYGDYNPPKKKKRDDENQTSTPGLSVGVARPNQNIVVGDQQNQPLAPKKPVNIFDTLNKNLTLGQPRNPILAPNNDTTPAPAPTPGAVIKPTLSVQSAPRQNLLTPSGQRVSDIPDTPEMTINKGLDSGKSWEQIAKENNYDVNGVKEYSQATRPNYGINIAKPKQSFWNKTRDVFDANTEADKYRRQQGNIERGDQKDIVLKNPGNLISRTPIVGTVTKMLNTGAGQIAELPAVIEGQALTKAYSDLTNQMIAAQKRGDRMGYEEAKRKIALLAPELKKNQDQQDAGSSMFEKNKGGLFNAGTLYDEEAAKKGDIKTGLKDIVLPTAVTMADLYTLGQGNIISEGLKTGVPKVGFNAAVRDLAPNIVKAGVGNFGSGAGSTISEGGNAGDALKAGAINSVLGTVPDVALPALTHSFKDKVLAKVLRGRAVKPTDITQELDDAAIGASAQAAIEATRPKPIQIAQNIPVQGVDGLPESIRVRNMTEPKPLIKEFPGDASHTTPDALVQHFADQAREEAAAAVNNGAARPNPAIEGVTPRPPAQPFNLNDATVKAGQDGIIDQYAAFLRDVGERNGTQLVPDGEGGYIRTSNNARFGDTKGKRMTKEDWRVEAERQLRAGKADPALQNPFNDAASPEVQSLLNKGEQPDVPEGRPIAVKQVNGIPVADNITVPTGLPETPGTVRAITQNSPMAAKSEAVANAPVVASPAQLPAETQAVLDNPSKFSKPQIQAARNQRKLARALAKAQEGTAEARDRIEATKAPGQTDQGFVSTGEFAKGENGNVYEKMHIATEKAQAAQDTANMSPQQVADNAIEHKRTNGGYSQKDFRDVQAIFDAKRVQRGTPEYNTLRTVLKEIGTQAGQFLREQGQAIRRTAAADEIIGRYESKLYGMVDDPTKIDSKLFDQVEAATTSFTEARDSAMEAYNRFTETPTAANAKLYHAAQDAADKADKAAKITEYNVADKVLKGNKDVKQVRMLQKMANEADLYQMDAVDASMLSGTGTFARNFVNSAIGGVEEALFGGAGSRVSRFITKENIGGGAGRGTMKGFREGVSNIVDASKARSKNAGFNPLEHIKNYATTGNQLGDTIIDSQVSHNVLDHYTQLLKDQGYKGRELTDRASVMARQDPDELGRVYSGYARAAAGLGSGVTRGNKIETMIKNGVSDVISFNNPNQASEFAGKLFARMTVGFPTAIGRSAAEGTKRASLGTLNLLKLFSKDARQDPAVRALIIKDSIKQAGTGATAGAIFYGLGANGTVTGSYPTDPEERARWERDGITENSIKIGGNYYQLPGYLGSAAIPALFAASMGRNGGNVDAATADVLKALPGLLPTDQASNVLDWVNGRTDTGKFLSQQGAGAVRASTPAGALLNQISKSFDDTKNDTTSDTALENFVDKVLSGIPGVNNMAGIPDKVDDAGNPIQNPGPVPLLFGAQSAVQGKGEQRSEQLAGQVVSAAQGLKNIGALDDPNLKGVLDDKTTQIYNKVQAGKTVSNDEIKKLQDAFVKGVSTTGEDTAYLEREQYDTNLAALKLKKQLMEADKTVKPSDLKNMDTAIKRGEVYKENTVPYDMIDAYQSTGVDEWRKMGIPPGDKGYDADLYDPEMYQKLYDIDQLMTKAGVSYRKGALDKNKFFVNQKDGSGSGKGSRGGYSSDFGTLKAGKFAPNVQQYQTIDQQSGSIPIIRTVRPNIVHKIGSSG